MTNMDFELNLNSNLTALDILSFTPSFEDSCNVTLFPISLRHLDLTGVSDECFALCASEGRE